MRKNITLKFIAHKYQDLATKLLFFENFEKFNILTWLTALSVWLLLPVNISFEYQDVLFYPFSTLSFLHILQCLLLREKN